MRRFCLMILCLFLAVPTAEAAEGEKYVALTFDDGPSGRFTRRLLEGLAARDAKATFLLCGYRLEQYPQLAQAIADGGHEIGLHGYSHDNMKTMSRKTIARELEMTQALLPKGTVVSFLRPPGGCCSDGVRQVAQAKGLGILDWSVDPQDWANKDTSAIRRSVLRDIRDGDVVLLHDMSDSSVDAALAIIDELKAQGFAFVTVSDLAQRKGISVQPGQVYERFR
jgi:peptidoglycan/xylan/chitin deacetylase (PgdA/CDA1 family)